MNILTNTQIKAIRASLFALALTIFAVGCASSNRQPLTPDQVPHHPEVVVTDLPEGVNTTKNDFGLLGGGNTAYLTSTRPSGKGRQDLFRSAHSLYDLGQTHSVSTFSSISELCTSENEGTPTFTPDGLEMIFAAANRDDAVGSSDLYQADFVGGKWANVRNLRALNTESWESQPSLTSDGKTLYFVSDRDGGFGGQDIYVATRVGDNWTTPQNLGPIINTAGDEASPFIAADGTTLFFSSNGLPGLGGYDVFVTRNIGGLWQKPENAGTPINTAHDDLFYTVQLGTEHAFVSSDRDSTQGGLDIFSIEPNPFPPGGVTVVKGKVLDAVTKKPLEAAVEITDLDSNQLVSRFHTNDSTGDYLVVLQPGHTYSVTADAPGHLFYSDEFSVRKTTNSSIDDNIELSPVASGKTRLLIYFDFNSAALKNTSIPDLNRAISLMTSQSKMIVVVAGYTDSVGSAEFNQKLSEDRAAAIKAYIVSHGIGASRVQSVGHGKNDPVADNGTDEGRARNRRVEFQVQ
jgi:outer membrane protein OmpA-like peptidoglycan-associated protein